MRLKVSSLLPCILRFDGFVVVVVGGVVVSDGGGGCGGSGAVPMMEVMAGAASVKHS